MANRYWVGGAAAWDGTAGTKWALTSGGAGGQAIPTSADDVFFDAASGANQVVISTGNTGAKSITCTGFTGTLNFNVDINVSGNVTFVSGMTTLGNGQLIFIATATLISATKQFNPVINGSGITVTLGDALNIGTRVLTITQGTFTTSATNYSITAGSISMSGGTLTLNGSTVSLSGASGFSTVVGATINAGTSTISLTSATATFGGGGKSYNNVSFTSTSATLHTITGANTFNTLTLTSPSLGVTAVSINSTQTITTMVCAGSSAIQRIFLRSDTIGTARTITATTWTTVSDVDFRDITLTNTKSPTRGGDCGGNTNITFPAAKTVYWNLAGTQLWSATGWATSSGGAPAVNNFPLAQDTTVFDNAGAIGEVQVNIAWNVGTVNMSARTSAMTANFTTTSFNVYGNWLNGTGTTISGSQAIVFAGRSTQTITSNGVSFTAGITGAGASNTITLAGALTTAQFVQLTGTTGLNLNNNTLTSFGLINQSTDTRTLSLGTGSIICTGSGSSVFALFSTGLTVTGTAALLSLTSASAKTFGGGGANLGSCTLNQGGAGALTITGSNTFSNITNTYGATGATSILFTAGTTNTFSNWNASGTSGKLLTIGSVTAASHTLSKASGTVSADFLSVSRSTATGGATWYAGANSTNGGNNTGWLFSNVPSASGNFMMFF